METPDIRRKNLAWLCEHFGKDEVDRRLGYNDDGKMLSVLLANGAKRTNIGPKVCARIENAFPEYKPNPGWLSIPQWPGDLRQEAKREIDRIDEKKLEDVLNILRSLTKSS